MDSREFDGTGLVTTSLCDERRNQYREAFRDLNIRLTAMDKKIDDMYQRIPAIETKLDNYANGKRSDWFRGQVLLTSVMAFASLAAVVISIVAFLK